MSVAVATENLTVSYGSVRALDDVSLSVPEGTLTAIIGPNGAGKSTLIKTLMRAVRPDSGVISVLGSTERAALKQVAWVPQRSEVDWDFPVTVRDVVRHGTWGRLGLFGRNRRELVAVDTALARVGLEELADRQIGQLSGGQQQRTFIARALAQRARLYLMDEPFAGVDAATETAIAGVLRDLQREGNTVVVVHHDLATVRRYFDTVVLLNRELIACGPVGECFNRTTLAETYGGALVTFDSADPP